MTSSRPPKTVSARSASENRAASFVSTIATPRASCVFCFAAGATSVSGTSARTLACCAGQPPMPSSGKRSRRKAAAGWFRYPPPAAAPRIPVGRKIRSRKRGGPHATHLNGKSRVPDPLRIPPRRAPSCRSSPSLDSSLPLSHCLTPWCPRQWDSPPDHLPAPTSKPDRNSKSAVTGPRPRTPVCRSSPSLDSPLPLSHRLTPWCPRQRDSCRPDHLPALRLAQSLRWRDTPSQRAGTT
jgi:hypothetical protein